MYVVEGENGFPSDLYMSSMTLICSYTYTRTGACEEINVFFFFLSCGRERLLKQSAVVIVTNCGIQRIKAKKATKTACESTNVRVRKNFKLLFTKCAH